MTALPLHPAVVHVPLGLAFVMPALALGFAWALWTGRVQPRAWLALVALQTHRVGIAVSARWGDFVSTVRNRLTFMDPMFVAGVGIDVPLNKRVSIRPDVRGMWAVRDGHAYQMVLIGAQLAYHIDAHPVTPPITPR